MERSDCSSTNESNGNFFACGGHDLSQVCLDFSLRDTYRLSMYLESFYMGKYVGCLWSRHLKNSPEQPQFPIPIRQVIPRNEAQIPYRLLTLE